MTDCGWNNLHATGSVAYDNCTCADGWQHDDTLYELRNCAVPYVFYVATGSAWMAASAVALWMVWMRISEQGAKLHEIKSSTKTSKEKKQDSEAPKKRRRMYFFVGLSLLTFLLLSVFVVVGPSKLIFIFHFTQAITDVAYFSFLYNYVQGVFKVMVKTEPKRAGFIKRFWSFTIIVFVVLLLFTCSTYGLMLGTLSSVAVPISTVSTRDASIMIITHTGIELVFVLCVVSAIDEFVKNISKTTKATQRILESSTVPRGSVVPRNSMTEGAKRINGVVRLMSGVRNYSTLTHLIRISALVTTCALTLASQPVQPNFISWGISKLAIFVQVMLTTRLYDEQTRIASSTSVGSDVSVPLLNQSL